MKILFISISVAVVCLMRFHHVIRETYARDQDTVRYEMFIAGTAVLAFFVHEQIRPYGVTHYMIEVSARIAMLKPQLGGRACTPATALS